MTENQDRTTRAAAWAADLQDRLRPIIDRGVAVLEASPPMPGDVVGVERQARTAGVIARSVRAIVSLTPASRGARDPELEEDEMQPRDDSPENLERMRADLEARLDRLNAVLESKGIVVELGCWPAARPDREPVAALYEQGRVVRCGAFPALEEELMALESADGGGHSPDRADALVWAVMHLLPVPKAGPRVRVL